MATNQEARQASCRGVTSATETHNGDWLALFDNQSIAAGTFNERMLAYCNAKTSATHGTLNGGMQALAVDQSANEFDEMATFTPAVV